MSDNQVDFGKHEGGQAIARIFTGESAMSLPPQQLKVAMLLAKHPERIVFGNLRSIASWSGVSTLTILRLAKALGFKGYHALQVAAQKAYFEHSEENTASEHTTAVADLLREQVNEIREVGARIRPEEIEDVCRALSEAKRVYLCSTEPAATLTRVLARRLFFAGIATEVVTPTDALAIFAHRPPQPTDVVIGVHLWLVFMDVYRVIELASAHGARTIVFAGSPISPLLQISDHYLFAHTETGRPYSSWVPMMALFEITTARLIERNPLPAKAIYESFREQAHREHSTLTTRQPKQERDTGEAQPIERAEPGERADEDRPAAPRKSRRSAPAAAPTPRARRKSKD